MRALVHFVAAALLFLTPSLAFAQTCEITGNVPASIRNVIPDYVRSSSRSGGLAKAALFPESRASLPADGARSVAFASLPRAGSPRSQEADGPSCRSPDENRA